MVQACCFNRCCNQYFDQRQYKITSSTTCWMQL